MNNNDQGASSRAHARSQLLDFFTTAIENKKIDGLTVKKGVTYPIHGEDCPVCCVNIGGETCSWLSFDTLFCELDIVLVLFVQNTKTPHEEMGILYVQIQEAVMENPSVSQKTLSVTPGNFNIKEELEGEQPVLIGELTFNVNYSILPDKPFL